jgi:hypothetical protein
MIYDLGEMFVRLVAVLGGIVAVFFLINLLAWSVTKTVHKAKLSAKLESFKQLTGLSGRNSKED